MAWMLMTESPPRAPAHIEPRAAAESDARLARRRGPSDNGSGVHRSHAEAAPRYAASCDAWVLFGDVERALLQAGMLDVLIGILPRPAYIYSSGVAVTNALLAASGNPGAIVRGWESLRSAHFLAPAGLLRIPAFHGTTALSSQLARTVGETIAKTGLPTTKPILMTFAADGLERAAGPSGDLRPARLRDTLPRDDTAPASIATAISTAAGMGVQRIYLFGSDPQLRGHPLITAAVSAVSGTAPDLEFLACHSGETPGTLAYLLPGSGGPDRLIRDGRSAAKTWLKRERKMTPPTDRRPASV